MKRQWISKSSTTNRGYIRSQEVLLKHLKTNQTILDLDSKWNQLAPTNFFDLNISWYPPVAHAAAQQAGPLDFFTAWLMLHSITFPICGSYVVSIATLIYCEITTVIRKQIVFALETICPSLEFAQAWSILGPEITNIILDPIQIVIDWAFLERPAISAEYVVDVVQPATSCMPVLLSSKSRLKMNWTVFK